MTALAQFKAEEMRAAADKDYVFDIKRALSRMETCPFCLGFQHRALLGFDLIRGVDLRREEAPQVPPERGERRASVRQVRRQSEVPEAEVSGSGGIDARERHAAASDGGRSKCDKEEATLLFVRPRIFIGGG